MNDKDTKMLELSEGYLSLPALASGKIETGATRVQVSGSAAVGNLTGVACRRLTCRVRPSYSTPRPQFACGTNSAAALPTFASPLLTAATTSACIAAPDPREPNLPSWQWKTTCA